MEDVQGQMQQKPERTTSNARPECESGLEDFVHGQLDDCVRFGSCSTIHSSEDGGGQGDQLVRRRRRSDLEGDDLAESSAARRRHSRILSRWAARQAEDMITTMEMRNRETELMALARLHTVSMLDPSFLRESESPTSRSRGNIERYDTQASSILQMWRELEDENMLNRAQERLRRQRILESNRNMPGRRDHVNHQDTLRDVTGNENGQATFSNHRISQNENQEQDSSSRGRSPILGDVERERVRDIVRGWMGTGTNDHSTNISSMSRHPRDEWLGDSERERVRIVREWVQMASQPRGANGGQRDEHNIAQVDHPDEGSTIDHEGQPERIQRELMRLQGRQALIDLLVRIENEQQRELQSLVQYRAVSEFAHRNRILSLFRGRFSRNGSPIEDDDDDELIQLRQRHPVSGLRDCTRARLESLVRRRVSSHSEISSSNNGVISRNEQAPTNSSLEVQQDNLEQLHSRSHENDNLQTPTHQEHMDISTNFPRNLEGESAVDEVTTHPESASNTSTVERNLQDSTTGRALETSETNSGNERLLRVTRDALHEDGSSEVGETWSERSPESPRNRRVSRRFSRFHPPDDESVNNMELRELMSRRSVQSVLHSEFRANLDQFVRSVVNRQGQSPINWGLHRNSPIPDHDQRNEDLVGAVVGNSYYRRASGRHFELELQINHVREDVARLEQGMSHMQAILEASMDMQIELQRSIRQEVAAALNRSTDGQGNVETSEDGSKWCSVRNGTCCVCCEDHIDTLLYRCGHMCTCSKCANELFKCGGKCPLCRAPIMEVVRAYSIE